VLFHNIQSEPTDYRSWHERESSVSSKSLIIITVAVAQLSV